MAEAALDTARAHLQEHKIRTGGTPHPDPDDYETDDYIYSIERGITEKYLCDYEVTVPVFEGPDVADKKAALARMIRDTPEWRHILAYCNTVEEAGRFVDACSRIEISAAMFHGRTPMDQRQYELGRFRMGEIRVLVTVYVIGEGFDVPMANTCMFVEPRSSDVNVTQCVCRVLRPYPEKNLAYVVLSGIDEEASLRRFVRVMSVHDPRIMRASVEKKIGQSDFYIIRPHDEIAEPGPEGAAAAEAEAKPPPEVDLPKLFEHAKNIVTNGDWGRKYEMVRAYAAEHDALPLQRQKIDGWPLDSGSATSAKPTRREHSRSQEKKHSRESQAGSGRIGEPTALLHRPLSNHLERSVCIQMGHFF